MGTQFRNGLPTRAWTRAFRERYRDITVRAHERKETAKVSSKSAEHVVTLTVVLDAVFERHPTMKTDPRRVWNLDETDVSGEYGIKLKFISDSSSNNSGARMAVGKGKGKHLTMVVIFNDAGDKLPPFFIF